MKVFPIGFSTVKKNNEPEDGVGKAEMRTAPKKSLVRIYFPSRNMTLAYYNDRFDLHVGDIVYVDGKLEGLKGNIVEVIRSFKIRLSEYKRVISVVDNRIDGTLFFGGSHVISFEREALSFDRVKTWFFAPSTDGNEEEFAIGDEADEAFSLDDLSEMGVDEKTAERGCSYYSQNCVKFLSLDGTKGRAIVKGSEYYIVEFSYCSGKISDINCTCFCGTRCKHEVAVMLQLRECLGMIEEKYGDEYTGCFSAVYKYDFIENVIAHTQSGKMVLQL